MTKGKKIKLIQGNEACTLGAMAAGATFYAGYPITPSTEIAEQCARIMEKREGTKFIQMEDEIASMGAIIGAASVGHKAFTATSGPGFSLMQELIGYAAIAELPLVIVDVMRAGPSTGLPTLPSQGDVQQARWGTHGDHSIIAISPNSITETYYETIRAFNLAQEYRNPVVFLLDEKIGHMRERFDVDPSAPVELYQAPAKPEGKYIPFENVANGIPPFIPLGQGERYHITGLTHNETGFYSSVPSVVDKFIKRLSNKIENDVDKLFTYEEFMTDDAELLFVAYGSVSRSTKEAVVEMREQGIKAGMLRLITIWPFHDEKVASYIAGKKAVVVPEMNLGQLSREVQRVAGCVPVYTCSRVDGDLLTPGEIIERAKGVL